MPSAQYRVLTAPGPVARAAARVAGDAARRWLLAQPRAVRVSFADEVLEDADDDVRQQVWMLRQPKAVRESYIREVLLAGGDRPPRG